MTEKELKRLTRTELLEMLLEQTKKIDALTEELSEAKAKLASREIAIANSGSLADAALAVSGIMESAQKAADLYLENLKSNSESGFVSGWTAGERDGQYGPGAMEDTEDGDPADSDVPEKNGKPETKREKDKRLKEEAKKAKEEAKTAKKELKEKKNGENKHVGLFGRKAKAKDNGASEK